MTRVLHVQQVHGRVRRFQLSHAQRALGAVPERALHCEVQRLRRTGQDQVYVRVQRSACTWSYAPVHRLLCRSNVRSMTPPLA